MRLEAFVAPVAFAAVQGGYMMKMRKPGRWLSDSRLPHFRPASFTQTARIHRGASVRAACDL